MNQSVAVVRHVVPTENSPVAEEVAPRDAWALAEVLLPSIIRVANSSSAAYDSMLPLYQDFLTVLVVQAMSMAELRRGMTVVFIGDQGRKPVAHIR